MTPDVILLLRQSVDKRVRITCNDGEIMVAKIDLVDTVDEEIVYEMLSTTNQSKYEKFDLQPAYLIRFSDISAVEVLVDSTS